MLAYCQKYFPLKQRKQNYQFGMWLYECRINLNKKLNREDDGLVKLPCIKACWCGQGCCGLLVTSQ